MFDGHDLAAGFLDRFVHHSERPAAELLQHLISVGQSMAIRVVLLEYKFRLQGGARLEWQWRRAGLALSWL